MTLTYGRDKDGVDRHERATVLTYSDVQIWLKRLRNDGYPARYIIAGEYGTRKGRAHWHGVIFWQKKIPPIKLYRRFWDKYWDHGHQVWKKPAPSHVRYCCKYIRKDVKDKNAQSKFQFSKVPPIGTHYFVQRAREMVKQGLVPLDRFYTFPEAKMKKSSKPLQFYLTGATYDYFMAAYCDAYEKAHPWKDWPPSELLHEWAEKHWPNDQVYILNPRNKRSLIDEALDEEIRKKEEFRKEHERYYFGKNRIGLYETDWVPDGEEEPKQKRNS